MATLVRDNVQSDGTSCTYHRRDVALLVLIGNDTFTLDVSEQRSMFAPDCSPAPVSGSCTSRWQWTFRKD
jgi:hypothetical protein